MSEVRIYCTTLATGEQVLSPEESHHLVHVLRAKTGQPVTLFDGAGGEAKATLVGIERRTALVNVESVMHRAFELAHRVTLAVAVGKQNRHAYMIEKCTELGVYAVWPMIAAHSVTRPNATAVEKWRRRAIEASKQSGRAWTPEIRLPQRYAEVLASAGSFAAAGYCDRSADGRSVRAFLDEAHTPCDVLLLVGPEGGWSDHERQAAREAGLNPVTLGPTTLRWETAAVAVCAAASAACVPDIKSSGTDRGAGHPRD